MARGEGVQVIATLRLGSQGPAVVALQRALATAGYYLTDDIDGDFGPVTEAAVETYQLAHSLDVDGVAGEQTLAELGLAPLDVSAPPTLPTGADPHAIPTPPEGWLVGVDLSDNQGQIDGEALAGAGVAFAWIKASDGLHDGQRHAAENARRLQGAGVLVGFYGVLEPYGVERVEGQVLNFCRRIRETGVTPDLAPWCDFELAAGQTGLAALSSAAAWCDLAEAATGRGPILYTGPAFISQLERLAGHAADAALARLALRPLSVAHYGPSIAHGPTVPAPWRDWALWQYSGDPAAPGQKPRPWSTLPGTTIPVDVDLFRGDLDALRTLG